MYITGDEDKQTPDQPAPERQTDRDEKKPQTPKEAPGNQPIRDWASI